MHTVSCILYLYTLIPGSFSPLNKRFFFFLILQLFLSYGRKVFAGAVKYGKNLHITAVVYSFQMSDTWKERVVRKAKVDKSEPNTQWHIVDWLVLLTTVRMEIMAVYGLNGTVASITFSQVHGLAFDPELGLLAVSFTSSPSAFISFHWCYAPVSGVCVSFVFFSFRLRLRKLVHSLWAPGFRCESCFL